MVKIILPSVLLVVIPAVQAGAFELALESHQAVYRIALQQTGGGAASVVYASGVMKYSVQKVCDDWTTGTTIDLELSSELTGISRLLWRQSTKEAMDGCAFDFTVSAFENNEDKKELEGVARCEQDKKRLVLTYPLASEAVLPKNVMFPMQQTAFLIAAANKGKKTVSSYVYDGTRLEALNYAFAVISENTQKSAENIKGDRSLLGGKSHWFDIAFYNDMGLSGVKDGSPFYEAGMILYNNGIGDRIVQNFGSYTIESSLVSVDRLENVACPAKK